MGNEDLKESWHLEKKVTIALIITSIIQVFFVAWYASKADSRIEILEINEKATRSKLDILEKESRASELRIIRIEDKLSVILEELRGLKTDLKEKARK